MKQLSRITVAFWLTVFLVSGTLSSSISVQAARPTDASLRPKLLADSVLPGAPDWAHDGDGHDSALGGLNSATDAMPQISISPDELSNTQYVGEIVSKPLTIRNDGPASLTYSVAIGRPAGAALLMHLDEPAGAIAFDDSSGNNHAGSCSGEACPTAGVVGKFGTALRFDGSNDYVKIGSPVPAGLQVQNELSLVAWIYVTSYPPAYTLGTIVGCQYDPTRSGYALHLDGRTNPDGQPSPPGHLHFQIEDGSLHTTNTNAQVPLNQWVHVAAVRKANENARIYYNGMLQPSTSVPWTGGITYSGAELDLGRESDYGNRFFNGLIDEVAIYNRALSAQEVEALYQAGSGGSHVSWLSADPSAGTVAGHTSAPVQVTFDATDRQPGTYQTMLFAHSNDPATPLVSVPANMTVVPDADMGWVEGTVTDAISGNPVAATIVALGQPYTVLAKPDGTYKLWLDAGSYTLQVSASNYATRTAVVSIAAQQGTIEDFALELNIPRLKVWPESLAVTHQVGDVTMRTLTIRNDGPASLTYSVAIGRPAGAALLMHLDEPAGAIAFDDSSGNNHAGSCSGEACPTAGVVGKFGTALRFDGSNDYVKIGSPVPAGLQVQNELSLVAWIYVTSYPPAYTLGTIVGCQYDPTRSGYALHLDGRTNPDSQPSPPGHLHFQIEDGSLHTTNANAQVPLNQWVHVAAVRKTNENARIYYNGVLQPSTSVPWTGGITYSGAELDLGRESDYGNRFFNGLIDEVAIYNRALSAQEVEALYQAGSGGSHVSWLSTDPSAGTVAGHTSAPVQVTFDATGRQPDTYQTTLSVQSNDPVTPLVSVPVSMGVVPDAEADGPYTITEGGSVTLNGTSAYVPGPGDTLTYAWDLDNDGVFETAVATPDFAGIDGPASHPVALQVCDSQAVCGTDTTTVEVTNVGPTADAGADVTVYRNGTVALAGTWTDPAAALDAPYAWSWDLDGDGVADASGAAAYGASAPATTSFATEGVYDLTFTVTDADGASGQDTVRVTVLNHAPDCTAAAPSPARLWPPNNKFVPVAIGGTTDGDGDALTLAITSIRQDEPVGKGNSAPDGKGIGATTAELRAEKLGNGNGRFYHVSFTASDGHGGACMGVVRVAVPHDQAKPAMDGGPLHDSTVPTP